jgi:hypothetical protein
VQLFSKANALQLGKPQFVSLLVAYARKKGTKVYLAYGIADRYETKKCLREAICRRGFTESAQFKLSLSK